MLVDCLKYMDSLLDKVSDHVLLDQLYSQNKELCNIIVLSANKRLSLGYVNRTLKLAVRFLQLGECLSVEFVLKKYFRNFTIMSFIWANIIKAIPCGQLCCIITLVSHMGTYLCFVFLVNNFGFLFSCPFLPVSSQELSVVSFCHH